MARSIDVNEVPQIVKEAFYARFPGITPQAWEMEAEYEAEFMQDGKEVEVNFYSDGTISQIEYSIDPETLPDSVKAAVKSKYPSCEISEAERIEKANGTVLYEVDLSFEVHITPEGKIAAMGKDL